MDHKLKKWKGWLKVVESDIQQLLIKKDIFRELQNIIGNNSELPPSNFYNYLGDTYVAYIGIGIRRQVKVCRQSTSFARLLTDISENPSALSRKYHTGLYEGSDVEDLADSIFDKFSGSSEKNYISKKMVESDLKELKRVASKIENFADKRIAHHDSGEPKAPPTFKEVDDCLCKMDKLYLKYYRIFHATTKTTLMPTYQDDWKKIFELPWLKR